MKKYYKKNIKKSNSYKRIYKKQGTNLTVLLDLIGIFLLKFICFRIVDIEDQITEKNNIL